MQEQDENAQVYEQLSEDDISTLFEIEAEKERQYWETCYETGEWAIK